MVNELKPINKDRNTLSLVYVSPQIIRTLPFQKLTVCKLPTYYNATKASLKWFIQAIKPDNKMEIIIGRVTKYVISK